MSLKAQKDTLWCYMKDTNIYIKFTILERCLHYLMINPRRKSWEYMPTGDVMLLGKLQCRGIQLICLIVGKGPNALAISADGVVWTFFLTRMSFLSSFNPPTESFGGYNDEPGIRQSVGKHFRVRFIT